MTRPTSSGPSDGPSDSGPTSPAPEGNGFRSTARDREKSLLAALGDDLDLEEALQPSSKAGDEVPKRRGAHNPYGRAAIPRQLSRTPHPQPEAESEPVVTPGRERRRERRPKDAGREVKRRRPSTIREGRRSEKIPRVRRPATPPTRSGVKSPGVTEPRSAGFFKNRDFRDVSTEVEDDLQWDDLPAPLVPSAEGGQTGSLTTTMPAEPRRTPSSGLTERRARAVRMAKVQRRRSESRTTQFWILFAALVALCVGLGILFLVLEDGPRSDDGERRNESEAVNKP